MLEIIDLAKRYGPVVALDGASFTARPGPDRRLPRAERRGQDHDDALHLRARPARIAARSAGRAPRWIARRVCASATCPSSAASTRGCASPSSSATSPSSTACPARRPTRRRCPLAGADGAGGPREVEARGAVARQPAARSSWRRRSSTTPSCSCSTSRSRARPDRHRDDDRGHPGASRGRRRRHLLEPPARPRRGRLRGRRDHRPRPDRRRRARSRSSRPRRAASTSRSRSSAPSGAGSTAATDVTVLERAATGSSCWSTASVDLDALLRAAQAAGEVRTFAYEPPRLSELFMEAVAPTQPPVRGGGVMPRWRSIWLVARREILERGRSRGFILSVALHHAHRRRLVRRAGPPVRRADGDQGRPRRAGPGGPARPRSSSAAARFDQKVAITTYPDAAAADAALDDGSVDVVVAMPADLSGAGDGAVRTRSPTSRSPRASRRPWSACACRRRSTRATSTRLRSRRPSSRRPSARSSRRPRRTRRASCSPTSARC